ncbi:polyamine ABC transporter substrate-binding protein [Pseudomonas germanica]|uniref:Polyamine ABC transporter substrate-binding protein n=1 Tax=Pseudomonas germanica TaxID=2815720 RepID=A0ABX8YKL6_9PSED|nr:polyamine ABC transporter substrate-binding protein [Pseudomonas germanica]QYY80495.1 polyamine ABC transporter substrate-binding protein [Pseudomonas germanica]
MKKIMKYLPALSFTIGICVAQHSYAAGSKLAVYNWTEYLPKSVVSSFEKETGISVQYDVFDTAETLEAKLLTGNSGYDLAFPSHDRVPTLVKAGAILEIDHSKLSNWKNLDPEFLKNLAKTDPGNAHAVPYLWGTTLIGYNKDKVQAAFKGGPIPNSWSLVFDPQYASKVKDCGVAFIDAPSEVFSIALRYLGLDPNATDQPSLEKARDLLMQARPNITYFHSARWLQDLANGDICVVVGYSGGVAMARDLAQSNGSKVQIGLIMPDEGALAWSDDMVIPKGAKNIEEAYKFIDYIQRPDIIAQISNVIGYPNANPASSGMIDPARLADEALFIPEPKREKLFFQNVQAFSVERMKTRYWNTVKSGQ